MEQHQALSFPNKIIYAVRGKVAKAVIASRSLNHRLLEKVSQALEFKSDTICHIQVPKE
jgi:hypothetical protein